MRLFLNRRKLENGSAGGKKVCDLLAPMLAALHPARAGRVSQEAA
jgi:hypothetical protein